MLSRGATVLVGIILVGACATADDSDPFDGITKASLARDRLAAQWVVDRSGRVGILDEGGHAYNWGGKLPDNPFRLIHVQFPRPSVDRHGEPELNFADNDLRILDRLESLTSLQIAGTAATGAFVKSLSGSPQLVELGIAGENVRASALAGLKTLRSIRELSLGGPMLTENCLEYVAGMDRLEILSYSGRVNDGRGFAALEKLKTLRELHICVEELPLTVVEAIARLPQVSVVELKHETRADRGELLRPLAKMPGLESLTLWTDVTDGDLANLKGAPRLRTLSIVPNLLAEASLAHLRDLPELRELRLQLWDFSPRGIRHLAGLTKLRKLELAIDKLDAGGCEHLSKIGALTSLTVIPREFNGEGLSHLSKLANLTRLHIDRSGQNWSETGLKELATLSQLHELIFYGSANDDDALEKIAQLPKLQFLSVTGHGITERGFKHLTALRELKELSSGGMQFSVSGLEAISQISNLESLSIGSALIARDGIRSLASLPRLQRISIFWAKDQDADGIARFSALANLRSLSIDEDELTTKKIDALGTLTQLRELTIATRNASASDLRNLKVKLKNCKVVVLPAVRRADSLHGGWLVVPGPH